MNNIQIIILAAGKGSRMKSKKPKVLQKLAGKTLLQHLVDTSFDITQDVSVIYGFGGDLVKKSITSNTNDINWIYQECQNGTGSAVKLALPFIDKNKKTLILYGDAPLISTSTILKMLKNDFSLLTINLENPFGYGRIIRQNNQVKAIVEQKDLSKNQQNINEVNTGIMAITGDILHKYLPQLTNNNNQKEYYLTDIVALSVADDVNIDAIQPQDNLEVAGVNNKIQLEQLERDYQVFQALNFMDNGLTIIDKSRFDNRGKLIFGTDCEVDVNTVFIGENTIGNDVEIGANCQIINSKIESNTKILANSIVENAIIGENVIIGPFARLRPQTNLANNTKVGNFVEIKKSNIGECSKINHLSYVGDSEIGKNVNIGAGTITCNYDGVSKHQTIIEDNAFIGSNSALIAPVKIGKNATIGAGSTISKDCENDKLSIARAKQLSFKWPRS